MSQNETASQQEPADRERPSFVYVTYIRSTRKRVFQALTNNAMVPEYWFGHTIESNWEVGGPLRFYDDGQLVHDDRVLAYDPPSTLSYSWRPLRQDFAAEGESRVTFTLEEAGDHVKLTMVHDQMQPGGKMLGAISLGWPMVLSGLKSLLETGAALNLMRPQRKAD